MSPTEMQHLMPALATLIAGVLMTKSGMAKNMLRFRHPDKRCASCGLLRSTCRCHEH